MTVFKGTAVSPCLKCDGSCGTVASVLVSPAPGACAAAPSLGEGYAIEWPTPTPSVTPSATASPTASRTPTKSVTPSVTPSISLTGSRSASPTVSPSRSITPTAAPTVRNRVTSQTYVSYGTPCSNLLDLPPGASAMTEACSPMSGSM
jgi:hypothetical protein